jgi:hypothetical protein
VFQSTVHCHFAVVSAPCKLSVWSSVRIILMLPMDWILRSAYWWLAAWNEKWEALLTQDFRWCADPIVILQHTVVVWGLFVPNYSALPYKELGLPPGCEVCLSWVVLNWPNCPICSLSLNWYKIQFWSCPGNTTTYAFCSRVSIDVTLGNLVIILNSLFWKFWSILKCVLAACPQAVAAYVSVNLISDL